MIPTGLNLAFAGAVLLPLTLVAWIDVKERRIPNTLNLAIWTLGMMRIAVTEPALLLVALRDTGIVAGLFFGMAWFLPRIRHSARIGAGDLKFLVATAPWVAWQGSIVVLFGAALLACLLVIVERPRLQAGLQRERPFGPMLAASFTLILGYALIASRT